MSDSATTFSVLTPPGAAAVAVVALCGPRAWTIVREIFRPNSAKPLPANPDPSRFWYGHFGAPPGDAVIVSSSGSAQDLCAEIHCHGGPQAVRMICSELFQRGALSASTENPLRQNSLTTAARIELSRAPTVRTAAILLEQMTGAFQAALNDLAAALSASDWSGIKRIADELAGRALLGRHLTRPWAVAVAGVPNVGKSSLVNALAGFERSVVTAIPGTTRDLVTTNAAIDGWPIELIDTAGQHATADDLEGQAIVRGRQAAAAADLCLWVVDAIGEPVWPEIGGGWLFVINKCDLPPAWHIQAVREAVLISARTGAGIPTLCEQISRRLVPEPPPPGAAVPFTQEIAALVDDIVAAVAQGNIRAVSRAMRSLESSAQPASSA